MDSEELTETIIRMDERGAAMAKDLEHLKNAIEKRLDSHAGKIRALEMWRTYMAGAGAVTGAVIGYLLKKE